MPALAQKRTITAAALLAGAFLILYLARIADDTTASAYGDDNSVYLVSAESLSEGTGYRLPNLLGSPRASLYPVGYPAVLAGLAKAAGTTGPTWWLLGRVMNAMAMAAFVGLSALVLRRYVSQPLALVLAAAIGLNVLVLTLAGSLWSEPLYALVATAAVLLAWRFTASGWPKPPETVSFIFFAVAAALIRTVGVTVVVGTILALVTTRQWRKAGVVMVGAGLLLTPFLVPSLFRADDEQTTTYKEFFRSDFDVGTSFENVGDIVTTVMPRIVAPVIETRTFAYRLGDNRVATLAVYAVGLAVGLLVVLGLALEVRRRDVGGIYGLCYLGAVVVWPWPPYRFLLPVLPLLVAWGVTGWKFVLEASKLGVCREVRPVLWALIVMHLALAIPVDVMRLMKVYKYDNWGGAEAQADWEETKMAMSWVRGHTPAEAMVFAGFPFGVYLFTDRKTADVELLRDEQFMARARRGGCPLFVFAEERRHTLTNEETTLRAVRQFDKLHPGALTLRWSSPDGKVNVHELRAPLGEAGPVTTANKSSGSRGGRVGARRRGATAPAVSKDSTESAIRAYERSFMAPPPYRPSSRRTRDFAVM